MIHHSKLADERREAGPLECWLLHGAVGVAADWRAFSQRLADARIGTRAVDLWRFLEGGPLTPAEFGAAIRAEAASEALTIRKVLLGYSMGGRLALHALLEKSHPWQAAVIVSAHPGLERGEEREARRSVDAAWAAKALAGNWDQFLSEWDAQPVLGSTHPRDGGTAAAMARHRREIARGFVDWSLGVQEPLWHRLGEINIPVLWVAGQNDAKFLDLARRAVALLPQARLAVAPGAGHRVPWEAEGWLACETAGFLTSGG